MQAQAVELLCRCDDIPDDGIELRVLKGLLTAVTSNAVHVHGQALLLVRCLQVDSAHKQGSISCITCLHNGMFACNHTLLMSAYLRLNWITPLCLSWATVLA